MHIKETTFNNKTVAIVTSESEVITDVQSALDLIMAVKYESGTNLIALDKKSISENFFILSSGVAGEILQKFVNYKTKLAIFGDFSVYTSKPLRDFIYESTKGNDIFFVSTQEEALEHLTRE